MGKEQELKERIDELKWKSLPFFERLVWKKEQIHDKKFYTKSRLKELRWFVICCNVLIVILGAFNIWLFFLPDISVELQAFCWVVWMAFIAQKLELRMRLTYLKEALYLKHLKKEIR